MTYSQLKPKVHRSNPLRADRFGEPYAAHIVKDVAQTLLKILDYPHRCHVLSLRHSSRYPLKSIFRTTTTNTNSHTSSTGEYVLRNILVPPLTSRILAIVFTGNGISVENADFLLK